MHFDGGACSPFSKVSLQTHAYLASAAHGYSHRLRPGGDSRRSVAASLTAGGAQCVGLALPRLGRRRDRYTQWRRHELLCAGGAFCSRHRGGPSAVRAAAGARAAARRARPQECSSLDRLWCARPSMIRCAALAVCAAGSSTRLHTRRAHTLRYTGNATCARLGDVDRTDTVGARGRAGARPCARPRCMKMHKKAQQKKTRERDAGGDGRPRARARRALTDGRRCRVDRTASCARFIRVAPRGRAPRGRSRG